MDADSGENGTVSYRFHSSSLPDTMDAFSVNSRTGEITLRRNARDLGKISVFLYGYIQFLYNRVNTKKIYKSPSKIYLVKIAKAYIVVTLITVSD